MGLAHPDGYFDNLVVAAKNKKEVLEELVTNLTTLTTLTTRNAEMAATIKKITGENRYIQQQLNSLKNLLQ